MKNLFKYSAAIFAACAVLVSCNKEQGIEEPSTTTHSISFVADELDTKTSMTIDGKVATFKWEDADAENVYVYENDNLGNIEASRVGNKLNVKATFNGDAPANPAYYAYVNSDITLQVPSETSYDGGADVLVADSFTPSDRTVNGVLPLVFSRKVAVNKMTIKGLVPAAIVEEVTITADKDIAGKYVKNAWTEKTSTLNIMSDEIMADESGNAVVYFTCLPVENANLTIDVTTDEGCFTKQFSSPITFIEGSVKSFGVTVVEKSDTPTPAESTTATWVAKDQDYTNGTQYTSATVDSNISLAFGDGTNDGKYYDTGSGIRIYAKGKVTVSAANGATISEIVLTYSAADYTGAFAANKGEYSLSSTTGTWTGSASSVVLTNNAASGHARIQTITVTYTAGSENVPTTYNVIIANSISGGSVEANPASAEEGAEITLTATPVSGYKFDSWNVTNASNSDIITITDNKFIMPASDVNVNATFTQITDKTIAEFIANEGGMCYLTGIVSNIANTTYGNFNLTDETGTIYVYGCLTPNGETKQFSTLGVEAGDKIKVLANKYELYGETKEAVNVIFVEELAIEKPQYIVTIETPDNGILVVKEGENVLSSGTKVEEGKTLTIECTPSSADYRYKNWQYKEDGNWATNTTTMTRVVTKDISIRANFELIPVYKVAWSVNGSVVKDEDLKEGTPVAAPEVIAPTGTEFLGWVNSAIDGSTNDVPQFVTPAATAVSNVTYYAVFATKAGEGSNGSIELTNADIQSIYDSKSTSYKEGSIGEWAFKGIINKASDTYYVQMNRETATTKSAYNSHISTPVCPAPIKSVVINTTNSTASGRTFVLTNSAEVGAASTTGEGVYGYGSLTQAAGSVTIDVTGNPTSLHIYPHGGAVYVSSIIVNYGTPSTYSGYCTIVK